MHYLHFYYIKITIILETWGHTPQIGSNVDQFLASNNYFQHDNGNVCHVVSELNDFHADNKNVTRYTTSKMY